MVELEPKIQFFSISTGLMQAHPTLLQAEEKRARNPVPKCPSKLLEPAIGRSAGWSSLQGHFGTELRARFSSAWSTAGCENDQNKRHPQPKWFNLPKKMSIELWKSYIVSIAGWLSSASCASSKGLPQFKVDFIPEWVDIVKLQSYKYLENETYLIW